MWADFVTHANAGVDQEDRRSRVPSHCLRAYQPAHLVKRSKMARKRTQQRWCGLLPRIAKQMRATLGSLHPPGLALDWLSSRANNVKGGRRNTSTRTVDPVAPAGG